LLPPIDRVNRPSIITTFLIATVKYPLGPTIYSLFSIVMVEAGAQKKEQDNSTLFSSLPRQLVLFTFHWLQPKDLLALGTTCSNIKTILFPGTKASTDLNNMWKSILVGTGFVPPSSIATMKIRDVDWFSSLKRLVQGVAEWTPIPSGKARMVTLDCPSFHLLTQLYYLYQWAKHLCHLGDTSTVWQLLPMVQFTLRGE